MVIITADYGQLGNRLFLFGHFIANATEHNYTIIYPYFHKYAKHFEYFNSGEWENDKQIKLDIIENKWVNNFLKKIVFHPRLLPWIRDFFKIIPTQFTNLRFETSPSKDRYEMENEHFVSLATQHKLIACGWLFRDEINFGKHRERIKYLFAPLKKYQVNVDNLIANIRKNCDILVGVHIRRGDYAHHEGGRYFYDINVYEEKMQQLQQQFDNTKKIAFLVCSDEVLDISFFRSLDVYFGTAVFVEDLYALSACDYIFGPPSTFSLWAAYYGEGKYFNIESPTQEIKLELFKEINTD